MRSSRIGLLMVGLLGWWGAPLDAAARQIDAGQIELSASWGVAGGFRDLAGLDVLLDQALPAPASLDGLSDTHLSFGGGVAAGLRDDTLVRIDVGRTRLFSAAISVPGSGTVEIDTSLVEVTGGVDYALRDAETTPFLSAGGGLVSVRGHVRAVVNGEELSAGVSDSGGTYHLGGGLRAALGERLGIRPTLHFVHISGDGFWRATFGIFYILN